MNFARSSVNVPSTTPAVPAAWNSLPTDIRCIIETQSFKKLLKSHISREAFNTVF